VAVDKTGGRVVSVNGKDGRLWNELDRRPLDKVYPTSPLIPVPMSVPDDEAVAAAYRPYRERTNAQLNEVIGEALDRISVIPSDSGESAAGNLVADAVRSFAKSDIGIVDAQSVEAGLEKGPIKLRNAFDLVGGVTREQIVVVRMKGSEVIAGLSAGLIKDGALRLQVSGATLTYRRNASGGAKVTGMMVAGVPIDPHKDYTLAGQAYVIQGFMEQHASLSVISESTETAHEAVARYIRSIKKVNPPETGRTRAMSDEQ
jgi:2',3'-cyclic-nucleotide 2'-phosphodiesterase (5'-nucleotidase family)